MSFKIGEYQELTVSHFVDFGAYLYSEEAETKKEVLLPRRYVPEDLAEGDKITVFLYNDSEDRIIATTETPLCKVGDFVLLRVAGVNEVGAFMDWGLPKDLLVPYREQKVRMQRGRSYIVYVYLDDTTKRIVASAKLDKFVGNVPAEYQEREEVEVLITQRTELGYKVIVNNLHWGMLYHDEVFGELNIGERHIATVKKVRDDDKVDLLLGKKTKKRVGDLSETIMDYLRANHGSMRYNDHSDPEEIRVAFGCSKKDFKRAVGGLYKAKKIIIDPETGRIKLA